MTARLDGEGNLRYLSDASYQVSIHLAVVSEKKIFLEINQSETRIACGGHVC
jgi:hypothetical protein